MDDASLTIIDTRFRQLFINELIPEARLHRTLGLLPTRTIHDAMYTIFWAFVNPTAETPSLREGQGTGDPTQNQDPLITNSNPNP